MPDDTTFFQKLRNSRQRVTALLSALFFGMLVWFLGDYFKLPEAVTVLLMLLAAAFTALRAGRSATEPPTPSALVEKALYWKLIIFKVCNGLFIVTAMAFLSSTDGIEWHMLNPTQKIRLVIFCLVAGGKFLDGFFDQSLARMSPQNQNQIQNPNPVPSLPEPGPSPKQVP